jgi:hypothetical protein
LKGHFSRAIASGERISSSREKRRERGIWQRRYWEHLLRNQDDFNRHVDYIHWNPVKTWLGQAGCGLAIFQFRTLRPIEVAVELLMPSRVNDYIDANDALARMPK